MPWLKISHHKHTGRLRPHEYTSYFPLAVLLTIVGIALVITTVSAHPGPQGSSISLTGEVPGPPPTVPARINTPGNNTHFTTSPITVSGSCPNGTTVEIFKNNIFAGSTECKSGSFSVQVDLLIGKNTLIARVYDALNQTGPDSNSVVVYYDILPVQGAPLAGLNFAGTQLLLETDAVYRGSFPGQEMNVPINIIGGAAPYAINVQWGDSANTVVSRSNNVGFNVSHIYQKPGIYQLSIQGTDSKGRVAFISVAAIVNGQSSVALSSTTSTPTKNELLLLWPLYTAVASTVASFWLGEHREKRMLTGPVYR